MFGPALDIAIGVIFFYLMFSLLVSALNEFFAWLLSLRSKTLRRGVGQLLDDKTKSSVWRWAKTWIARDVKEMNAQPWENLAAKLYDHPLVKALSEDNKLPSYIPSTVFASAMIDILQEAGGHTGQMASSQDAIAAAKNAVANLPSAYLQKSLNAVLDESVTTLEHAKQRLASWFDDSMERVSGWYKRYMQMVVFISGAIVTIGLNGDTIVVTKALASDPALRAAVDTAARDWVNKKPQAGDPQQCNDDISKNADKPSVDCAAARWNLANQSLVETKLPIGWTAPRWQALFKEGDTKATAELFFFKFLGLLITVFALSQGAPFWFDLLNRVVNIKSNGPAPSTAANKAQS